MGTIHQINNKLYINGEEVEKPKSLFFENCLCQVNDKIYINGKEKINGKWKYTIKSVLCTLF